MSLPSRSAGWGPATVRDDRGGEPLALALLERTRTAGNARMFQINHASDAARAFATFEWELVEALGGDEAG